eukprot:168791-Rhodomonas_salina.1
MSDACAGSATCTSTRARTLPTSTPSSRAFPTRSAPLSLAPSSPPSPPNSLATRSRGRRPPPC